MRVGFALTIALMLPSLRGWSDEAERNALVEGALRLGPTVVRIDRVAAVGAAGDLYESAPTSGLIIDPSGLVLTSRVTTYGNPSGLLVSMPDGARYGAKLIAEDRSRELALLQLSDAKDLPSATLEPVGKLAQGAGVIAVGCAVESDSPMVSLGIISGSGRMWGRAIQTDARVSLSQLGGPLVDAKGRVVGILVPATGTEMAGEQGTDWYDSGVAMAIPVDTILGRLDRMKEGTNIEPGLMGISWNSLYVPKSEITGVVPGSPAARAGLRRGDRVTAINGQPIERMDQLRQRLGEFDAKDTITLTVQRESVNREVRVELIRELPAYEPLEIGIWCESIDGELRIRHVASKSAAEEAKLVAGDRIVKANGEEVSAAADLSQRMNLSGKVPLDLVLGDGRQVSVVPRVIGGELPSESPLPENQSEAWSWSDFALPEFPNKARLWGPAEGEGDNKLGLLVIAAGLERKELDSAIEAWKDTAQSAGVMVLVVGPRDAEQWQVDEAEVLARAARQALRRWKIEPQRVGVTGEGAGASLALISAFTYADSIRGVATPADTKFPRMRLKMNDPAASVQILWIGGEQPKWLEGLRGIGYATRYAESADISSRAGGSALLRWNQWLGSI